MKMEFRMRTRCVSPLPMGFSIMSQVDEADQIISVHPTHMSV